MSEKVKLTGIERIKAIRGYEAVSAKGILHKNDVILMGNRITIVNGDVYSTFNFNNGEDSFKDLVKNINDSEPLGLIASYENDMVVLKAKIAGKEGNDIGFILNDDQETKLKGGKDKVVERHGKLIFTFSDTIKFVEDILFFDVKFMNGTHRFVPIRFGEHNADITDEKLIINIIPEQEDLIFNTVDIIAGIDGLTSDRGPVVIKNTSIVDIEQ